MARIHFELTDADKDRFQRATRKLNIEMSEVLRVFVSRWLNEHRRLDGHVGGFLIISLSEELYQTVMDKAMHKQKDISALVSEHLESWSAHE